MTIRISLTKRTMTRSITRAATLLGVIAVLAPSTLLPEATAQEKQKNKAITLETMGSMFAGGSVITAPGDFDPTNPASPAGQTLHVDHVYAQYKIPVNSRVLPLVMWHGCLSTAWETTPDGREGYESIFVRRGWKVYVIDQPRQGRSGKSSVGINIVPTPGENASWNSWRLGTWPNFFPGVLFPQDAASLDHFWRQGGAGHGPNDQGLNTDSVAALFAKIGPGILVTHSASGILGWLTALKSSNVKGIVAYEPSNYIWPEGKVPPALPLYDGTLLSPGQVVSQTDFDKLTKIPIQMIFSDGIPTSPDPVINRDNWRLRMIYAQQMVDLINSRGGDAEFLHLPDIGIDGNTHFAFSDLNNVQIADLMSEYLHEKKLDTKGHHSGK